MQHKSVFSSSPSASSKSPPECGFQPVPAAPLGIYAKTASAFAPSPPIFEHVDRLTGEVKKFTIDQKMTPHEVQTHHMKRAHRFALKAAVNDLLPRSRTSKCHRWLIPNKPLEIRKSDETGKAFFSGVQICASVWRCPVCAAKITERRRVEVRAALDSAHVKGLKTYLLTLTVPHGLGDDINSMLDKMMQSWRSMTSHRAGIKALEFIGRRGFIRALEVTHGKNGFHPHFHILLFLDTLKTPSEVQQTLSPVWQKSCLSVGLPMPSDSHGCRVDDGEKASQYVAKGVWGLDAELTKGHVKKSKSPDSRTPVDLLQAWAFGEDHQARKLWLVYAEAFHGRRQLYWSNGLRDLLELRKELTDEQIAAHADEPVSVLHTLTLDQWRAIIGTYSETLILDVSEFNPSALPEILASVEAKYARLKASPS